MDNNIQMLSDEPTKVDAAASDACTRSGTVALLLTVTLALLIPYWIERRNEEALARYVSYRLDLANQIETLDETPMWNQYKVSDANAESKFIAQLVAAFVQDPKQNVTIVPPVKTQKNAPPVRCKTQHSQAQQTAPPGRLTAVTGYSINLVQPIADSLALLNDSELLSRSRRVSNYFNFSIVRWVTKRNNLAYENQVASSCFEKSLETPGKGRPPEFYVPALDKDALLKCLRLEDVRKLAQLELPTFSNPAQTQGKIRREVEVNPNSLLPKDLYTASALVQLLMFFAVIHFAAYGKEATASPRFPVQGTLFHAFSGSRGTLLVFLLALWSPLFSSLGVAITSRQWSLIPCTLLLGSAVLFAHSVLHRKSFFSALNPRPMVSHIFFKRTAPEVETASNTSIS